jgi:transcription initiation factor IIE alpha subunit
MQKVSCPSCGAEVTFRSAASVMAVCEYCHSTLLKDAESVKDIGKMSEVLEDYSPIQINTSGEYQGKHFTVVGRIQLRYDDGFWNEWYVLFDDGSGAWLSDASGQYVFTIVQGSPSSIPQFEQLKPGAGLTMKGNRYIASDVRTARCVAGQGELPFKVGTGWEAKVADFRSGSAFLTLDYSDVTPQLYLGQSVDLAGMRCQLLRSEIDVAQTAGKYRGKTTALSCPNCGSPIKYQAGMAFHVVCPSCNAQVDCSTDKAIVLEKHDQIARVITTLALGDVGTIDGLKYEVIGFTKCKEVGENADWIEYLLFDDKRGFLWLVESDHWDRVKVLDEWPQQQSNSVVELRGAQYNKLYQYGSEVVYAAGAFNWRVAVGDRTRIIDYGREGSKLTAESSDTEIVWSVANQVSEEQVKQWFAKKTMPALGRATKPETAPVDLSSLKRATIIASVILAVINLPIALVHDDEDILATMIGLGVLWIPFWLRNKFQQNGSSGDSGSDGDD